MRRWWFTCAVAGWLVATAAAVRVPAQAAYDWKLPRGFPPPVVPADNPMTEAKVTLGRYLFYDTRLSGNGTQSCGSCHQQDKAFTDGRAVGRGSTGETHHVGAMSLVNVAYAAVLTWANPSMRTLEEQILVPMYGDRPIELGLTASDTYLQALRRDARYPTLFREAFGDETIARDRVVKAIATFERAIVSARSPYDRYHFDRDDSAISDAAKRGEILFHSRGLSCFTCHGGIHFSGAMGTTSRSGPVEFHNTGLYNVRGAISYPEGNAGVYDITHDPKDVGRFKAPTLRNIAVTAPYMHDGSVPTLDAAIEHYAAGGRTIADGPNRGVGRDNPNKSEAIGGFALTPEQRADLVAFLESLTDTALLYDPRFSNPFTNETGGQQ